MKNNPIVNAGATLALALLCLMPGSALAQQDKPLRIAYVTWSSSTASANVAKVVLQEKLDYPVELVAMTADDMWRSVSEGKADVMLSAWLPDTHAHYLEKFGDTMVDLGPNMTGVRTGLVVPDISTQRQTAESGQETTSYISVNSIEELKDHADRFHGQIIGIDPAAGIMKQARKAIEAYGLTNYTLVAGSEESMTRALERAISQREWVVVTGWEPHWAFARWRLKYLDDPKGVFSKGETIHTMVRKGLKEEVPDRVYAFLDSFQWTPEQMGRVLIWNQADGAYPFETAQRWVNTHSDQVQSWLP
jgi:glycine betaine/proline transport system substrate-binding protein